MQSTCILVFNRIAFKASEAFFHSRVFRWETHVMEHNQRVDPRRLNAAPAAVRFLRLVVPKMIDNGGGSIINTASNSGIAGDLARVAYGASKGGIITLSKYVATQYGKQNIRCNSVAPGVVLTPALEATVPGLKEVIQRHILTPEFGTPDDIAALVAFLASDESRYITGENISISGGGLAHQPHYADLLAMMEQHLP